MRFLCFLFLLVGGGVGFVAVRLSGFRGLRVSQLLGWVAFGHRVVFSRVKVRGGSFSAAPTPNTALLPLLGPLRPLLLLPVCLSTTMYSTLAFAMFLSYFMMRHYQHSTATTASRASDQKHRQFCSLQAQTSESDDSFVFREPRSPKAITVSRTASVTPGPGRARDSYPKYEQNLRKDPWFAVGGLRKDAD